MMSRVDAETKTAVLLAARRGVAWKLAGLAATQALRVVALLAIARALTPREFGLAAIAVSFWAVGAVLTDLALAAALVQRAEIDERARSTAFWASTASGLALAIVGVVASGAVASLLDAPDVRPLVAVLGAGVLLNALSSTHVALLTRAMDFRTLELASISATAGGAVVGVALAFAGAGAWAIVANAIASAVVTLVLVWSRSDWRPKLLFSRDSFRDLFGFATLMVATRLAVALLRSADRLLIGRFLGAAAAGAYALPASVVLVPAARLVDPVRSVLFPAFARLQSSVPELRSAWLRSTRLVCVVLSPVLLALALAADEFVSLVLTSRWSDAAPILRILAVAGLFQLTGGLNAVALAAMNRLPTVLTVFTATAALSVAGFFAGLPWGISAAAAGYAGGTVAVSPFYAWVTARAFGATWRDVAAAFAPTAAGLTGMLAFVAATSPLASSAAGGIALVGAGAAVHAGIVLAGWGAVRRDLAAAVRSRRVD